MKADTSRTSTFKKRVPHSGLYPSVWGSLRVSILGCSVTLGKKCIRVGNTSSRSLESQNKYASEQPSNGGHYVSHTPSFD